jgi:hypothetical protein
MFGTKVLRKTFQLKAEEVPGKWRKTGASKFVHIATCEYY